MELSSCDDDDNEDEDNDDGGGGGGDNAAVDDTLPMLSMIFDSCIARPANLCNSPRSRCCCSSPL